MASNDHIELTSGYKLYANGGFISINDKLEIAQGWDGGFPIAQYDPEYDVDYPGPSKQDMIELAIRMQTLWINFRHKLEGLK